MRFEPRRQVTDEAASGEAEALAPILSRASAGTDGAPAKESRPVDPEWPDVFRALCEQFATQAGHSIGSVSVLLRLDNAPGERLAAARLCEQIAAGYRLKARAVPSDHEVMVRLTRSERQERAA